MEHTTVAVTVAAISNPGTREPYKNPNDVNFKVAYSKDYKGPKYMTEGEETVINKDLAADFEKRGIGSIVKDTEGEETVINKDYSKMKKADLIAELTLRELVFDESAKNADLIVLLEESDKAKQ